MNKLKEKEKSQKGERNLISYCKILSYVTSLLSPLKFLVFGVFVALLSSISSLPILYFVHFRFSVVFVQIVTVLSRTL